MKRRKKRKKEKMRKKLGVTDFWPNEGGRTTHKAMGWFATPNS
jgi:hypothetical protein